MLGHLLADSGRGWLVGGGSISEIVPVSLGRRRRHHQHTSPGTPTPTSSSSSFSARQTNVGPRPFVRPFSLHVLLHAAFSPHKMLSLSLSPLSCVFQQMVSNVWIHLSSDKLIGPETV